MGIGKENNVNAYRIIFLFDDNACVYPAQSFEDGWKFESPGSWKEEEFWIQTYEKGDGHYIERNGGSYFSSEESDVPWNEKYLTFWTKHEVGVIGIQLRHSDYENLLPSPVLEEPYPLSFITLFDKDWNLLWDKTVDPDILD